MNEHCEEHSGLVAEIENAKDNIKNLWHEINTMKTWVIIGMGSLLIQLIFFVGSKFIK
jgi:tRNA A22 N-methylase